jgi:bacillolysin
MKTLSHINGHVLTAAVLTATLLGTPMMLHAQKTPEDLAKATRNLELATGGPVSLSRSSATGLVTFFSVSAGHPIPTPTLASASREEKARTFLGAYGEAFGIQSPAQLRVLRTQGPDEVGREYVRFQQLHRGVPVTGGELTVHLSGNGVVAVNAKTLANLDGVDTVPTAPAAEAAAVAQEMLRTSLQISDATLSEPRLEILDREIFKGAASRPVLTWFIEATKLDLRQFIWVDAHTGALALSIDQLTHALTRSIHDAHYLSNLPGDLVRSEGGPTTGDADADAAYDFSGDTYNYYFTQHGRDSFDNAGAPLISTVHYCPDFFNCPMQNAFWNGTQMVYGDGFSSADDADAHELTHAVTEHSANLYYYMQSGALNESYSDIFGETVDLTNGRGDDSPAVRWLIGEDIPGYGALRDMMHPNDFGDPGKMSDSTVQYFQCNFLDSTNPPQDSGGVHTNSGVPNHAYALMVDGGDFNGFHINGIGLTKAAKVEYRALTRYLLSASDFLDNYNALKQSCADLIGQAGITVADCGEVGKALDAVEMSDPWPCLPDQPQPPALCPAGQTANNLFFDDFENTNSGNWVTTDFLEGSDLWHYPPPSYARFATSGVQNLWGDDPLRRGDAAIVMTRDVAIPTAGVRMQFNHSYGFEDHGLLHNDGGVVEYSTNGGATWQDAGALITAGAVYNGMIADVLDNPLGGRQGFVDESYGYTASQLDLTGLAGRTVRFRFHIGSDTPSFIFEEEDYGWFIDDIRIYQCGTQPTQRTLTVTKQGTSNGTVTSAPTGINCGGDCSENYNNGAVVTLTPTPATGATFAGWSGDPDCGDGSVTMTVNKTCIATFNAIAPQTFTLTVNKTGTGAGTVTATGINCGADCSESYNSGTAVTLTATPAAGATFAGWSGDPDCADGSVTMTANKTCTATFNVLSSSPIQVKTPSSGDTCVLGKPCAITWSATISGKVKIEVSYDGGNSWVTVIKSTANDSVHRWRTKGVPTTQARIRVSSVTNSTLFDVSDSNFTIR